MTNQQYHSDTSRISKSGLDKISISPLHYYEAYLNTEAKREETKALYLGSAIHSAVLEPEEFEKEYFTVSDSEIISAIGGKNPKSTAYYKKWLQNEVQKHEGQIMISNSDYDTVQRIRDSVYKNEYCAEILAKGKAEQTIHFNEPFTNAPCKIRPDWLSDLGLIADLKTAESASPNAFARSAYKYRYYVQHPFYLDGVNYSEYPNNFNEFVFIAVEKKPPYIVAVYVLEPEAVDLGRSEYIKNLETYMECKAKNKWPSYQTEPEVLKLPKWAYYKS